MKQRKMMMVYFRFYFILFHPLKNLKINIIYYLAP